MDIGCRRPPAAHRRGSGQQPKHGQINPIDWQGRGLSEDELASMMGVSAGEIEDCEKQSPKIYDDQTKKLKDVLGIDSSLLLDDYAKFVPPGGCGQRIKALHSELGLSQKSF